MIHYGRQDITQADIDAVIEVLKSDFLTQGPVVPKFEDSIAKYCGASYGVAVNSATSALHISCLALGVGEGDIVWTAATTFVASSNCAIYCGASVDFVDIDSETYNMSVNKLKEKLEVASVNGKLPKVVIPVHMCGQSCEMEAIHKLAEKYKFKIIEDASHAVGAQYRDKPVGDCRYSDITVFSFHPVKIITTGEGGLALTNSPELAENMQQFRSHGITGNKDLMDSRPEDEIWNYQQIKLGLNYRMTEIQAALGLSQLDRLDEFVSKRQEIAKKYDDALSGLPLKLPAQHLDCFSSYHLYPIRVKKELCGITQKEAYAQMHNRGIIVNLHYIPVYRHPFYEKQGFKKGYCPQAELYFKEAISIPVYPGLTSSQLDYVITSIVEVFS